MQVKGLVIFILAVISTAVYAEPDNLPVEDTVDTMKMAEDGAAEVMPPKRLRYVLGVGITAGGDELVTVTYSDGSTDSVTAGGFYQFHAGVDYRVNDDMYIQGTVGYHIDSTKPASNGKVTFSRFPLELMAYYQTSDVFRIGGGTRLVLNPELKGDGIASAANISFSNTLGLVVEGEYMVVPALGIKMRYVVEKYKANGFSGSANGNHIGIMANIYL